MKYFPGAALPPGYYQIANEASESERALLAPYVLQRLLDVNSRALISVPLVLFSYCSRECDASNCTRDLTCHAFARRANLRKHD